jgi:hypothetical protein
LLFSEEKNMSFVEVQNLERFRPHIPLLKRAPPGCGGLKLHGIKIAVNAAGRLI